MANANTPFGLKPVRYLSGAPYNGAANLYCIPATDGTACYIGSLVKPAGSADANGIGTVTSNVSTGALVIGAVVGVMMDTRESLLYRAASTLRYVFVSDDPNLVYECQDDGASALAATNTWMVADLTNFTSGSTTTGLSSTVISSAAATSSGDNTEDVLLTGLVQRSTNAFGTYAKWMVRLNNHFYINRVTGA